MKQAVPPPAVVQIQIIYNKYNKKQAVFSVYILLSYIL